MVEQFHGKEEVDVREDIKKEFREFIDDWEGFKTKDLRIGKRGIEIDWNFDSELWSYDFNKSNIRFAIYKK